MDNEAPSSIHQDLIGLLERVGVSTFADYIGKEKAERFLSLGYSLDSHILAELLVIDVFNNRDVRG